MAIDKQIEDSFKDSVVQTLIHVFACENYTCYQEWNENG